VPAQWIRALGGLAAAAVAAVALVAAVSGCARADAEPALTADFRAEVKMARVDGKRIAWYERGEGPPLVMAIGTGSTMAEWDPALLRLLATERRLILYDYPGIGLSSPLRAKRTSFAQLADQTARFMDAIGVPRADVLGWSMGGFVAQQLAIRHPERVGRLVLAGTNPGGDQAELGDPDAQEIDSDPDRSDEAALEVLYPLTPAGQAEGRAFLARLDDASERGEIPDDFEVSAATVRAQVAAEDPWLASNANWDALAALRTPVLAAGGALDRVVPPVNLERIAARIPGARLEMYPGAAHAFLFQERARFARTVLAFLAGAPAPPPGGSG
jgi:pimeloyl-ACP methyl ester carboxylesterase